MEDQSIANETVELEQPQAQFDVAPVSQPPSPQNQQPKKKGKVLPIALGIVGVIVVVAFLFGTHIICIHNWSPATCEDPQQCRNCGKIVGEPNPDAHMWNEANCSKPRTCAACGKTEGDIAPDNHQWSDTMDKGYAICKRCGKTTGNVPDSVKAEQQASNNGDKSSNATSESATTEESSSSKTTDNATLIIDDKFAISPSDFCKKLRSNLDMDVIDKSDDESITYAFVQDAKNPVMSAMLSFSTMDGKGTLGNEYKYKSSCNPSPIFIVDTTKCDSAEFAIAFVMSCDPSLSRSDALDVVSDLAESVSVTEGATTHNGIEYRIAGNDERVVFRAIIA